MGRVDTKAFDYVKIDTLTSQAIVTFKKAEHETGRVRQQLEREDLDFGLVLYDEEIQFFGIKVILRNEKYEAFVSKCRRLDEAKKKGEDQKPGVE